MPLLRLIAEGVGPFEKLDLDFSDGHGNPHLGPHILAGVNGSGKSTALRAIAWVMHNEGSSFDLREWRHFLVGHPTPRVFGLLKTPEGGLQEWLCTRGVDVPASIHLEEMREEIDVDLSAFPPIGLAGREELGYTWQRVARAASFAPPAWFSVAAYAPSRALKHLDRLDRAEMPNDPFRNCLAIESTVDNEGVQAWLRDLRSRKALAKEIGKPSERYERSLQRFQAALGLVCGEGVRYEVELEPTLQLRLIAFGQSLNFSQLPDGIRNTVGWLADFMMRQDLVEWDPALKGKRPGILLLDEVDAHLHPRWQRTLLPAMRAALPDVQIIVTSHSPFVISSCRGARVHVLDLKDGRASLVRSADVPFGESVTATLREIFGVSSRFDVDTEKKLEEWNELSRQQAAGPLSRADTRRLEKLTAELAGRSEELRSIVGLPRARPPAGNAHRKSSKPSRRAAH
jgi:energy-coupling factor transporter ATP-binding protein EcfA2